MAHEDYNLCQLLLYAIAGCDESAAEVVHNNGNMLSHTYDRCYQLMTRDYACEVLDNPDGHLCSTYPVKMVIPLDTEHCERMKKLTNFVLKGRFARTRGRFVVPVLIVNGKYVCRSSTLARSPEIYCRQGYGYWVRGEVFDADSRKSTEDDSSTEKSDDLRVSVQSSSAHPSSTIIQTEKFSSDTRLIDHSDDQKSKEWLLDKMRNADINLLHFLKVDIIFDLMVEKKKVKFGMNVTSSEKVDRQQRYLDFNLQSVPYPGCEFFAEYQRHGYAGEGLLFDWKQDFVDADLHVPNYDKHLSNIDWNDYMNWDLITLTRNYLKLFLHSLMGDNSTGILLHCISGWDRTPLFVSLIRLSLWADGLAHNSLNAEEIVFLTVAYDWLLFNHQFSHRISSGEEIFYFCFDFLKYIDSKEYSMVLYYENESKNLEASNGLDSEKSEEAKILLNGEFCGTNNCEKASENGSLQTSNAAVVDIKEISNWTKTSLSDVSNNGILHSPSFDQSNGNGKDTVPECNNHNKKDQNNVSPLLKECENKSIQKEEQCNVPSEAAVITRKERLHAVREIAIKAYQEALQKHQEQGSNSGFATVLFNQLTKTLNLVKR